MTTEEKTVSTDVPPEKTDEKPEDSSKEVVVPSSDVAVESNNGSVSVPDPKEEEANVIKTEETEEGFETPEEGEGEEAGDGEQGEGEEEEEVVEEAKLDDDQDIESPAYIPKTGKYYMHDSREDTEVPYEEKKSRADGMWSRDRYDERYQQPRSRRQMIEKYGFDIRLGETKEIVEDKEKEMRNTGIDLDDEGSEKMERREMNKPRQGRMSGEGANERGKGQRRQLRRDDIEEGENGMKNDEDDARPAARRDTRNNRGSYDRGGRGEGNMNRGGNRGRGDGTFNRNDRGRGGGAGPPPSRQFNRTFNNSNRNSGREENQDRGAPKRYSTQRAEKDISSIPTDSDIVFFDPTKQTPRENKSVIREKKPLDIVPPPPN